MSATAHAAAWSADTIRARLADGGLGILPRSEDVARLAEASLDRLRGRSRRPGWLRPVLLVGLVTVLIGFAGMAISLSRKGFRPRADDAPPWAQFDRTNEPQEAEGDALLPRERAGVVGLDRPAESLVGAPVFDNVHLGVG